MVLRLTNMFTVRSLCGSFRVTDHYPISNVAWKNALEAAAIAPTNQTYSIIRLIEDQDWLSLPFLLRMIIESLKSSSSRSSPFFEASLGQLEANIQTVEALNELRTEFGGNVLHFLCSKDPPYSVVNLLIQLCWSLPFERDNNERYPLHDAAANGSSVSLMKGLIQLDYKFAAKWPDAKGRTPLMLACMWNTTDMEQLRRKHEIVRFLLHASPSVINYVDKEGNTTLELAERSSTTPFIVDKLRTVSQNEWTRQREEEYITRTSIQPNGHGVRIDLSPGDYVSEVTLVSDYDGSVCSINTKP
eukprot:scaffold31249_cov53-Attheya_sp.AAC.2